MAIAARPESAQSAFIDKSGHVLTDEELRTRPATTDLTQYFTVDWPLPPPKYKCVKSVESAGTIYSVVENRSGKTVARLPVNVVPEPGGGGQEAEPTDKGLLFVQRLSKNRMEPSRPGLFDIEKNKMVDLPTNYHGATNYVSDGLYEFSVLVPGTASLTSPARELRGYFDEHGKIVLPALYDQALPFTEGLAPVSFKNNKWCYINHAGKVVFKLPNNCSRAYRFGEGLAGVVIGGEPQTASGNIGPGARLGFIDKSGKVVIAPQFWPGNGETVFFNGLASVVKADPMHLQGYIDKAGHWAIPPKFDRAEQFRNGAGTAQVDIGVAEFDANKWRQKKSRDRLFNAFVVKYGVLGMTKGAVCSLLGQPDVINELNDDEYTLYEGGCGGRAAVCLRYQDGLVSKYKFNYMTANDWFDNAHPNTGDI